MDAYPLAWKTLPKFGLSYLQLLAETIDIEPPQTKDAVMLAMLASIGIEKGKPFEPQGARAELLTEAVREGETSMNDTFMNHSFVLFWPDRQWMSTKSENNFGYSFFGDGRLDYDRRAGGFTFWATWAPKRLSDPSKLPASYYLKTSGTNPGTCLEGIVSIVCVCRPIHRRATSGRSSFTRSE